MAGRNDVLLVQCSTSVNIRKMAADLCGAFVETEKNLIQTMTWKISNKYYDADVNLMTTTGTWKDCMPRQELECVDGLVLAFDPRERNSFDLVVKEWLTFVKEHKPAILLLVCNTRHDVLEWCIEHSFELVELDVESEFDEDDVDDGFMEKQGIARISEAIQTNTWPDTRKKASSRKQAEATTTAAAVSLESVRSISKLTVVCQWRIVREGSTLYCQKILHYIMV
ncbi:alpha- and gamma-adaptin-binding protein p34-like [Corticium candelabrum]|uniref:alpha- and gamma-adaptin-binding protein p34-like n=1 Tax=Corticium candelabrum TaxID=121492 RepID=UPI002E25AE0B|nr:alpha- and gamma-adaptin-binding protein p34-like [Corticium candelabrum]